MRWFAFILLSVCSAFGNHYIRAGATGSNNGTSWANAWTNLTAVTWGRGDTNFIAGGQYTGLTITTSDPGTWLTIKKANAADNSGDAGWDSSYGTVQAVITNSLATYYGHFEIDGVTGSGTSGHGIKIYNTFNDGVNEPPNTIHAGAEQGPYHFYHLEICGTGVKTQVKGGDGIWYSNTSSPQKGLHIASCWIHDVDKNGLTLGGLVGTSYSDYGMLFENNVVSETGGSSLGAWHGQGIQMSYNLPSRWCIFRNNIFRNIIGSGYLVFMDGASVSHNDYRVYNNIFYCTNASVFDTSSPGVINNLGAGNSTNILIANNTFYGISGATLLAQIRIYGENVLNCSLTNNIWEACYFSADHVTTGEGNNAYYANTGAGVPSGTPGQVNGASTTFADAANRDFTLKSGGYAIDAGADLSAIFTTDFAGNTRAGTWDIGAYDDGSTNAPVASGTVTTIGTLNVVNLHIGP